MYQVLFFMNPKIWFYGKGSTIKLTVPDGVFSGHPEQYAKKPAGEGASLQV